MKNILDVFHPGKVFKPGRVVLYYLLVVMCFSLATGVFYAVMSNYLADVVGLDEGQRGVLEFFRETPGLLLMVILALLAKRSEWWIMRFGLLVAAAGMAGVIFAPPEMVVVTAFIMMWSLGEHVLMPVRSSMTMHLAKPGQEGGALGVVTGLGSIGAVMSALIVVGIFRFAKAAEWWRESGYVLLAKAAEWLQQWGFATVFTISFALLFAAFCVACLARDKGEHVARPKLLIHRKYNKFYILEVFYGARKQVFLTFAPFMLIRLYGMEIQKLALLVLICAALNIVCAPLAGWIVDRLGYRTVMIWDTVLLTAVCLLYGFAYHLFSPAVAIWVVCVNYVLDHLITNASSALNVYVRGIAASREEVTATLSAGISLNHVISIIVALVGGWIALNSGGWFSTSTDKMELLSIGYGVLFSISATMAVLNTLFSLTLPKPLKRAA